ncbi:MAG: SH3 domain-containing protein [Anaeromicrobium sp.]|uniref:C40 family peptidase n=1 Tax=Anaeromicrobium sp. TaxID=1929132 RepID=UPI0025E0EE42|nr:C40 family peptidase [Anaeromicrobium sp.]MCT4594929.1 SH3 domain-containing protein [Anaeromicrobium sp.]
MYILKKCKKAIVTFVAASIVLVPVTVEGLDKGIIIGDNVNIRSATDLNSQVVSTIKLGSYVDVLENNKDWYKVQTNDKTGWIFGDYIVVESLGDKYKNGLATSNVNFRQEPSTNGPIIKTIKKNTKVLILESKEEWLKVELDKTQGWLNKEYVKVQPNYPKGFIKGENVNIRQNSNKEANVIKKVSSQEVLIKGYENDWYNIVLANGSEGWIHKGLIDVVSKTATSRGGTSSRALNVINVAKSKRGKRYVWGATGPNTFDCSGFTAYVYKQVGIKLPRVSRSQATVGTPVSKGQLLPGDLVFFKGGSGTINHVGIYLGGGDFIHCSSGKTAMKVIVSNLNKGSYKRRYVKARRVL